MEDKPFFHPISNKRRTQLHPFFTTQKTMPLTAASPCPRSRHEIIKPKSNIQDQTKPNAAWRSKWQTHGMTISLIERQDKANRFHEKWSISQQVTTFDQGFTHESEVKFWQVANTTMHELGSFATCTAGKVYFLNKCDLVTTCNSIQGDSSACNATAAYKHIKLFATQEG